MQLTSNQLILAICGLIVIGALLVLLGMVLSRFEASTGAQHMASELKDAPPPEHQTAPSARGSGQGQQVSPRALSSQAPARTESRSRPQPVEIPAPTPDQLGDTPVDSRPPVPQRSSRPTVPSRPSEPEPDADRSNTPAEAPPLPQTVTEEPAPPEPIASPPAVAEAHEESAESNAAASNSLPRSGYTVQVAAFSTANLEKAREFARSYQSHQPELVEGDDGFVRVFIGTFTTREAAEQRRRELQSISDFAECYVRSWNS